MKSEEFRTVRNDNVTNDSSIEERAQPSESAKKVKKDITDIAPSTSTAHHITQAADSLTPNIEQGIINKIESAYGNKIEVIYVRPSRMKIRVPNQDILHVATFIKENFN